MVRSVDMTGETYGSLKVIERADTDINGKARWVCLCNCGRSKPVLAANLKNGRTRSCGECQVAHATGLDPEAIRYAITVWSGPDSPSGKPFCFGEVRDALTNELVFRTSAPINRETSKGEIHAGVTRCMTALSQAKRIAPLNMRTYKRWLVEERVSCDVKPCGSEQDTFDRWYEVTGEERPTPSVLQSQGSKLVELPPLTADQQEGIDALMASWS